MSLGNEIKGSKNDKTVTPIRLEFYKATQKNTICSDRFPSRPKRESGQQIGLADSMAVSTNESERGRFGCDVASEPTGRSASNTDSQPKKGKERIIV